MDNAEIKTFLSWPFESDVLMRRQKSLKRQLLDREGISYLKKRIAIFGGSTTTDFKNMLEIFLLAAGIQAEFRESEYNQYYEDSVFPSQEWMEFQPDIVMVFTSFVNLTHLPVMTDSQQEVEKKAKLEYEKYESVWKGIERNYKAVVIQNNFEMPYMCPLGSFDAALYQSHGKFVNILNHLFAKYAQTQPNFYLFDIHRLAASVGLANWHNRFQYYAYKLAMNYDVIPIVALHAAHLMRAILGYSKKCLVLDLDNTLWGGEIGDVGVDGIELGHETPGGEAYVEFQSYVLSLQRRGILLAVCSKNEEDIAKEGFHHPDSVLKVEDFADFKANWDTKDRNIRRIAANLNIGLDSMVFLDDNPAERQLVRENLPEVSVPEVDPTNVFSYIQVLEENGYFEICSLSEDDFLRNETYRQNTQRMELKNQSDSYDEFLKSLDMEAEICSFRPVYFERISQLTNKSNQFNLTTRRYTVADIQRMTEDERYVTLYGRLRDRFGDNGLVSVVIGEVREDELHIILWLMSCRVLKRGMEYAMLNALATHARERNLHRMIGYYYRTKKNNMVSKFYGEMGFQNMSQSESDSVWILDISGEYEDRVHYIKINE